MASTPSAQQGRFRPTFAERVAREMKKRDPENNPSIKDNLEQIRNLNDKIEKLCSGNKAIQHFSTDLARTRLEELRQASRDFDELSTRLSQGSYRRFSPGTTRRIRSPTSGPTARSNWIGTGVPTTPPSHNVEPREQNIENKVSDISHPNPSPADTEVQTSREFTPYWTTCAFLAETMIWSIAQRTDGIKRSNEEIAVASVVLAIAITSVSGPKAMDFVGTAGGCYALLRGLTGKR